MKIMLDTNVLISALVFGGKTRNVLLKHLSVVGRLSQRRHGKYHAALPKM